MLRGLINDHILHLRECMLIGGSLLVSLSAGFSCLVLSGKKTDVRIRALLGYIVVALLVLVCPVTASALRIVTGTYYDSPDMWIVLPLIPIGAVMTAVLFDELYSREKKISVLAVILFAAAILLCGSLGGKKENTSGRPENAGAGEKAIAEMIFEKSILGGEQVILAPDETIAYLHVYSADARTLYGRDMWDGRLTKNRYGFYSQELTDIHDDMIKVSNGERDICADLCRRAFEQGATVVILPPNGYDEEVIVEAGYGTVKLASTDGDYLLVTEQ
ncbi:MAG: hypothetical protein J5570_08875 [Lachnospiraceae bacterium]|nr:hypothetical protein [Lachnospiraceae bacterium]